VDTESGIQAANPAKEPGDERQGAEQLANRDDACADGEVGVEVERCHQDRHGELQLRGGDQQKDSDEHAGDRPQRPVADGERRRGRDRKDDGRADGTSRSTREQRRDPRPLPDGHHGVSDILRFARSPVKTSAF
jgi:hypothetical protein